jgi:hypothetical protein
LKQWRIATEQQPTSKHGSKIQLQNVNMNLWNDDNDNECHKNTLYFDQHLSLMDGWARSMQVSHKHIGKPDSKLVVTDVEDL